LAHFQRASAINPSSSVLACYQGMAAHKLGAYEEALSLLQACARAGGRPVRACAVRLAGDSAPSSWRPGFRAGGGRRRAEASLATAPLEHAADGKQFHGGL
jgi:hypothetical protein